PPAAAAAAQDKLAMRQAMWRAGLPTPPFQGLTMDADPAQAGRKMIYPAVLKPTFLSASRGVIRVEDEAEFTVAFRRIKRMIRPLRPSGVPAVPILAEGYIPGNEVALEGLLSDGWLQRLAIFDKPDPLEGPYFEETIYVTPSRMPASRQEAAWGCAERAAAALGLRHGPIHAEVRLNPSGAWLLEVAPRSIGGWCSRALRFDSQMSLEELILRHALGQEVRGYQREPAASGILMIPIPGAGFLEKVAGLERARAIEAIDDIRLAVPLGSRVDPLPEGGRYLGFGFARAKTPQEVEDALRRARSSLVVSISDTHPG
ncbi:MAG: ATP-grasp domain-containing protein, partial [Anaerolineales bacterium]